MPQLDKVTFLSQFFWLCVFFFGFYIFQLKYFLPEMSRILKLRKKRLSESSSFSLQHENNEVRNNTSSLLENLLKLSKNVFKSSSSNIRDWCLKSAYNLNKKDFKQGNVRYLDSVAEKSLSNNLAELAILLNFSENIFFSRGIKYCLISPKAPVPCVSQVENKSPLAVELCDNPILASQELLSNKDLNDTGLSSENPSGKDCLSENELNHDFLIRENNSQQVEKEREAYDRQYVDSCLDDQSEKDGDIKTGQEANNGKLPSSNKDSNLVDNKKKSSKSSKKLPSSNKDLNCCVDNEKKELTKVSKKGENKASKKKSKKL